MTLDGQRIQVDGVATYEVQRPSGFRIEVDTAMKKRTFYYNGKTFTMNAPELGFYATVSAPPTIGQTLDVLWDKYQIDLPLDDLFRWVDRDTPSTWMRWPSRVTRSRLVFEVSLNAVRVCR